MNKILYAGDSSLTGAASYLAGVMTHYELPFDYVPSAEPLAGALAKGPHGLYVFSDYPAANLREKDCQAILDAVQAGAGLLMIGGWESFRGLGGHWDRSPLADALPVRMLSTDDRVNSSQPVAVQKVLDHPIVNGLPFRTPPHVGGYNRIRVKSGSSLVLVGRHVVLRADTSPAGMRSARRLTATPARAVPLLVVGQFGAGRTAAFASDAAPHWIGGMVDWGFHRVKARAKGGDAIEVGRRYAEFFSRLIRWTAGELS